MKRTSTSIVMAVTVAGALAIGGSALARTTVQSFENLVPNSLYGSWPDSNVATVTSGPTSLDVESIGFGGAFINLFPDVVDGSGSLFVEFDVTVHAGDFPGVVLALGDTGLTEFNYAWFGLDQGNHLLTATIDTPDWVSNPGDDGVLDVSNLSFLHVQVDDGGTGVPYNVSFNNLSVFVPEPSSLVLLVGGLAGVTFVRRRRR